MTKDSATAATEIVRSSRVAMMTRDITSRPRASVPNQWSQVGGFERAGGVGGKRIVGRDQRAEDADENDEREQDEGDQRDRVVLQHIGDVTEGGLAVRGCGGAHWSPNPMRGSIAV